MGLGTVQLRERSNILRRCLKYKILAFKPSYDPESIQISKWPIFEVTHFLKWPFFDVLDLEVISSRTDLK